MMKSKDESWAEQVWVRWITVLAVLLIVAGRQATAERSAVTNPLVPVIEGDYVHIYQPQGGVFSGPDTRDLKAGQFYPSWQPNDHCFVKGRDGHWHAFGITHPESQPGQSRHQGEFVSFHAVSPGETFESSLKTDSWADKPKVLPPAQRPGESPANHAPTIVKHDGVYKMIYGPCPFRMAVSEDLYAWTPKGPVGIEERSGRDPSLFLWNDTYILVYCAGNVVKAATSKDLADWSEPVEIFRGEEPTYQCESPTLISHEGLFYLFWCLWDTANKNGNGYDERSFVYCSDNPLDFHGHPRIAELKTHAPEIFQDEEHNWYISSAQYPARGISVSRLAWTREAATAATPDTMCIGSSESVPSVGERVVVRLYVDDPADQDVRITFPDGRIVTRKTDGNGTFVWIPRRYGKYVFRLGEIEDTIWVTAKPMNFFVWDSSVFRKYVTHVLKPREEDRCTLWRRRGARLINWAGGEHLSRQSKYGDRAFTKSSQWVDNWRAGTRDTGDGVTIDEIFVANRPPMGQLCKAVLEFRRMAGAGFDISPFFSGIEWDAVGPMWDLREADVPCMEENYWGGAEVYGKRWADVCLFHLDEQGTVLSQAPGFYLDESRRGPRTIEEFRADVALCRRIAPEMRGLSLFNAYDCHEIDGGADTVIEDLFLRPVIHLHPRNGKLMVQNIGNEDTVEGAALAFLASDNVLEKVAIPVLTPYEEVAVEVPDGAKRIHLELPEGMHSVYEDGVFELPENLDPLQVVWCSIRENDTIELGGDGIQIRARFNKPVKPIDADSVWLRGASVGMVAIDAAELSEDRKTLSITIDRLPEDRYSLRLLSGKSHLRDDAGHPLDGSGNGFCENAPGLYKDADHFAVDFRAVRPIW